MPSVPQRPQNQADGLTESAARVGKYTQKVYEAVKAGKVRVVDYFDFFGCFNTTKTCP